MSLHALYALLAENVLPFDNASRWTYQLVREGDFRFERAYLDLPAGRVAAHVLPPGTDSVFWHPHLTALGVMILSDGGYEMRVANEAPAVTAPKEARIYCAGDAAYELMPGMWHAVRAHAPCTTLVMFSRRSILPREVERYPMLSARARALLRLQVQTVVQSARYLADQPPL